MANTTDTITLGEVAKIKKRTIEDIKSYLARNGITIPADADYVLSATEIKAIDPILAFRLKYRKVQKQSATKQTSIESNEAKETSHSEDKSVYKSINRLDTLSSLLTGTTNAEEAKESLGEQNNTKGPKKNVEQKLIGIIKFYDDDKGFGYLVTNNKGINNERGIESNIKEIFVHSSGVNRGYTPYEGHWVTFTKGKDRRGGLAAKNVAKLEYDKDSIIFAFKYRGSYSKISGWDSKREHKYNENVISHVFNMSRDKEVFREALYEFIDNTKDELKNSIIEQLFLDDSTANIIDIVLKSSDDSTSSVESLLRAYQTKQIFNSSDTDWTRISKLFTGSEDISEYYPCIKENISLNFSYRSIDIEEFLQTIGVDGIRKLYTAEELSKLSIDVILIMYQALGEKFCDLYEGAASISDNVKSLLYVASEDENYAENIENWDDVITFLRNKDVIRNFTIKYLNSSLLQNEEILNIVGIETIGEVISDEDEAEQTQLIEYIDEVSSDFCIKLVEGCFKGTELYKAYISQKWKNCVSDVPYVVFDLESDGENINQFAYRQEDSTRTFEGEDQLKSLIRALKKTEIIVGHRIKEWDLKILQNRGLETNAFVWDTLEIEILLNPCRYAYALHTMHNAKDDTDLSDRLFWNQLYRLSEQPELCDELEKFLPESIKKIIAQLQKPYFNGYFKATSEAEEPFFQTLVEVDNDIIDKLKYIDSVSNTNNTLIVAPQNLWGQIARYTNVSFENQGKDIEFMTLSKKRLESKPIQDVFLQTVLLRFLSMSKTPIIHNIAHYLRLNYFNDETLIEYIDTVDSSLHCIDINGLSQFSSSFDINQIYFFGCELDGRLNQYEIHQEFAASDFMSRGCWLPMRMAGANFMILSKQEQSLLDLSLPEDVKNVWVERQLNGKYKAFYNLDYNNRIDNLKRAYPSANCEYVNWNIERKDNQKDNVVLVCSQTMSKFNAVQHRVGAVSRYRSLYWVTQIKMLRTIWTQEDGAPIVYVLDNNLELKNVEAHLKDCGFYVPEDGTLARKLEKIRHTNNGILVISKDQFKSVAGLREPDKYIYVWDNMAVDKCQMMWTGQMPFGDEAVTEKEYTKRLMSAIDATPKSCMLASWPLIEHHFKFIVANNPNSRLYILEPYFDNYSDLADAWNTCIQKPTLWSSQEEYNNDLEVSKEFYSNSKPSNFLQNLNEEERIKEAMDTIKKVFLPAYEWREEQLDALPAILSRKSDYMISIPTGGGKSVLFQGPALYNSAFTNRLSIVITPLKALMEDQIESLHSPKLGFYTNVDYLNGDRSYSEIQQVYRKINGGELALLYVTPERFRSRGFLNALQTRINNDGGLEYFIFDEAHCISQWGQEFRPEYLNVMKWCQELKKNYPDTCVAMFSATITKQIQEEVVKYLPNVERHGQKEEDYNPIRSHIGMQFIETANDDHSRIEAIVKYVKSNDIDPKLSRMLIFCRTRKQCEECCAALEQRVAELGLESNEDDSSPIGYFHAGMEAEDRKEAYEKFKSGNICILCATKAFGMGMDISNVHYIVHYTPPSVLEDYLQEVGRAGRNKDEYEKAGFNNEQLLPTICLCSKEDFKKAKELLLNGMLSWADLNKVNKAILSYIKPIQSIEATQNKPIVVPNNLWKKHQIDDSYTDFKIGMFWLERLERIRMGFLCPAHINISILRKDIISTDQHTKLRGGKLAYHIYKYISENCNSIEGNIYQVSVNDLRSHLGHGNNAIIDAIILCTKWGWLRLEQEMRCQVSLTRSSETTYKLNHPSQRLTIDIIFDAVSKILSGKALHREYIVDSVQRKAILNEAIANANIETHDVQRINRKGNTYIEKYMPWYVDNGKKTKNIGLALARNYENDLKNKRAKHIFTLLDLIPGVKFQSYLDTEDKDVKQRISLENNVWKSFMPELKEDCLNFLRYLDEKNNKLGGAKSSGKINWSEAIVTLGLESKGYVYFDNMIRILKVLAYITADSLMPVGIEVFTTPISENSITDKVEKDSKDEKTKKDFDTMTKMRQIRLAAMNAFSGRGSNNINHFISEYFKCVTIDDFLALVSQYFDENTKEGKKFMDALRDEAIVEAENKLGAEQREIYFSSTDEDINVLAGPGSGKTHVLTLRCAKLIYRENVSPNQILVLAYNRAVVVELRNRLDRLFGALGLGRSASQVHVHTFSALAKRVCGERLNDVNMSGWEREFLKTLRSRPADVKQILPDIRYIMIDEFQDITQTRLDSMLTFREIYPDVKFFTIGDKNQSIYGFDKAIPGIPESTSPDYYYKQLREKIHPHEFTMKTNYRSFQKILDSAAQWLKNPEETPVSSDKVMKFESNEEYVHVVNWKSGVKYWTDELPLLVEKAKSTRVNKEREKCIQDIAVFFRSNNEVYRGYERITKMNLHGVRIRIQGASSCELYRVREIHSVIRYLMSSPSKPISLAGSKTKNEIRSYIESLMQKYPKWDRFYLDFAYTLVLDFLEYAASEEEDFTYSDMADSIIEAAQTDDGQLYKIYDRYINERIDKDTQLNIILTTMHKVKGLEFDAVIVTPSFSSLPFDGRGNNDINMQVPLTDEEKESIEEEKRLMYVAYTRARKYLSVYKYLREDAIEKMIKCQRMDKSLGFNDKPGIDKFFLSLLATDYYFNSNKYADEHISKNDNLLLRPTRKNNRDGYDLIHESCVVGRLSQRSKEPDSGSRILRQMQDSKAFNLRKGEGTEQNLLPAMESIFVNEIFVWTYEDTVAYDKKHNLPSDKCFTRFWSDQAKKQGYIYIIDFAGYAKVKK